MDIHEYQAKQLLSKFGVNIPAGEVIYQPHEAITVTSWLNEEVVRILKNTGNMCKQIAGRSQTIRYTNMLFHNQFVCISLFAHNKAHMNRT